MQTNLEEYAFPHEQADVEEAVRNPSMLAYCTECGAVLKNMKMHRASGTVEDREGTWQFSCRTRWCNPLTSNYSGAGKGSGSVKVAEGEVVSATTNGDAEKVSVEMVNDYTNQGVPIIDPGKFEEVRRERDEEYEPAGEGGSESSE